MKFIIDKEKYIDTKLVDEKEHPFLPLLIYNYTPECQFSKSWDEVTMMCRGLIVHYDKYLTGLEILKVFDDRPSVIRMWRENGLLVEDVGNGEEF